ncbi:MAG: hypothetical protein ACXAC2_01100 [Candidatus Kariarchaeaceae archaeon]|jgi:hypothetical protein
MRIKKTIFLKKLKYRRQHWDFTIDTTVKNGLGNEKVSEKWFVKDVINHITWYEKELIKAIENESIIESQFWNMGVADRNDMIFKRTQSKTLNESIVESKIVFEDLIILIERMNDEELNSDSFIKRKTDKRVTHDFIGGISFWHYEDHEDALINRFGLDY